MKWRTILISIYFIPNILLGLIYLNNGILGGDFSGDKIDNASNYILIYFSEILMMILFLCVMYFIFAITYNFRRIKTEFSIFKERFLFYFIFLLQVAYLIYTQYYGVATLANKEEVIINNPLKYIFTFFNPDAVFLCSLILDWKSKKRLTILTLVFIISNFFRGWISGAILQIVILFLTKKFSRKTFKIKYIISLILVGITISPTIYFAKYVSRDAEIPTVERYISYYSMENYSMILERVFSRFQHLGETYTLINNIEILREAEKEKEFVPVYFDHSFRRILSEVFSYNQQTMNEFAAKFILKRESGGNIHTGILPWLVLSEKSLLTYIIYIMVILSMQYFLFRNLTIDNQVAKNYTIWFSMFYLWHGWFFGFVLLLVPSLFYLLILSFNSKVKI